MKIKKISALIKGMIMMIAASVMVGCSSPSAADDKQTSSSDKVKTKITEGSSNSADDSTSEVVYPIVLEHAFGETVLESKPERIATIAWGNQDVSLALGVVPVGVSEANYGVTDESGLLPWTWDGFKALGANSPVIFHDTDGLDYEAISNAEPDVILASYSGITQEEYDLLSEIAPVAAYPSSPWQTSWRDQIVINAKGMGMEKEGEDLVKKLEQLIADKSGEYPSLQDKTVGFFYFNPADLGKFYVYLPSDPRAAYLTEFGMDFSDSIQKLAEKSEQFAVEISAETVDQFKDVDIIVAYGDGALLEALKADSLLGTLPAIERESVVLIENGTPLAASGTPSALSIPATIDEYLSLLGEAADKVK